LRYGKEIYLNQAHLFLIERKRAERSTGLSLLAFRGLVSRSTRGAAGIFGADREHEWLPLISTFPVLGQLAARKLPLSDLSKRVRWR
jgi:hypothetical protein